MCKCNINICSVQTEMYNPEKDSIDHTLHLGYPETGQTGRTVTFLLFTDEFWDTETILHMVLFVCDRPVGAA